MINGIPVVGWLLSLAISMSLALPFWLCWTVFGIGQRYFYFLPPVFHEIAFWNVVGLFLVVGILKGVLCPQLFSRASSSKKD